MDRNDEASVIRIAGICGSLRPGSYSRTALNAALEAAANANAVTQFIDLASYDLPLVTSKTGPEQALPGRCPGSHRCEVRRWDYSRHAQYHGSFSGALKDALDPMGFEEFEGKMMGLIGVSYGKFCAFDALNSLRTVGRPACVGRSGAGVNSGGMEDVRQRRTFKTPEIARRLKRLVSR